jgi:DNA-binding winged helix-turn-helix (wHTH) protein
MRSVRYRFAAFELDSDTRQLLAGGREVHLSPKAFELLLMLVHDRARALSKTELQERLWPSSFVGETSLATLVAEIRRALGDSAHGSEYIRTVHRFGYRFVAAVTEAGTEIPSPGRLMYLITPGRQFALAQGVLVIGRAEDAAIQIDSSGVSRRHARVVVNGQQVHVEDLGSKNGTFVGGEPVDGACPLKDGDEIRVGPVTLTFRVALPTEPTETMN